MTIARSILLAMALSLVAPAGAALGQTDTVAKTKPYSAPMETIKLCNDELRKDKAWASKLEQEIRLKIHNNEAKLIAKNETHVFAAYSALWIIMVIFVVFTFLKNRKLQGEVERLQAEVERQARDG
jgi:hypothetical protein